MKLLIDVGNSRTKWVWVAPGFEVVGRGSTPAGREGDGIWSRLGEGGRPTVPDQAAICSVGAAERVAVLRDQIHGRFGIRATVLETCDSFAGVRNGYLRSSSLGVDRWMAIIAAWSLLRRPCVVADAGTALTVDVIAEHGVHKGGWIVPGVAMQEKALRAGTSGVKPGVDMSPVGLGTATEQAVRSGILLSLAGLIDRARVELQHGLVDTCPVFLTGGDAPVLAPLLSAPATIDEDLVFRGMFISLGA